MLIPTLMVGDLKGKKNTVIGMFNPTTTMTLEMCMWTCRMCMAFCVFTSDMFSISKAKHFVA